MNSRSPLKRTLLMAFLGLGYGYLNAWCYRIAAHRLIREVGAPLGIGAQLPFLMRQPYHDWTFALLFSLFQFAGGCCIGVIFHFAANGVPRHRPPVGFDWERCFTVGIFAALAISTVILWNNLPTSILGELAEMSSEP